MFPSLSVSQLLSDLSADAATISLDMPDGGYDRLHTLLESRGLLPDSKSKRLLLIAVVLTASRIVQQRLGRLGSVSNFLTEIGEDGIREQAKRILEAAGTAPGAAHGVDALWDLSDADRAALTAAYRSLDDDRRARLRSRLTRLTAVRLATLARVAPDELATVLDLCEPRREPRVPVSSVVGNAIHSVNEFFFPWMRRCREVSP